VGDICCRHGGGLDLGIGISPVVGGFNLDAFDFAYAGTWGPTTATGINFLSADWAESFRKGLDTVSPFLGGGALVQANNPVIQAQARMQGGLTVTGGTNPTVTNTVDFEVEARRFGGSQQFINGPDLLYGPPPDGSYSVPTLSIDGTAWGDNKTEFGGAARTQAYPNQGVRVWTFNFMVWGNF
jgi:hypothetical protein